MPRRVARVHTASRTGYIAADTEQNANPGAAVDQQGVGVNPAPSDTEHTDDPKSGGTPVHNAPTEDSPHS